tara:strand:+ start:37 stop:1671 length:1635 start_codon:yes stop_codon:yes gene_type:complete
MAIKRKIILEADTKDAVKGVEKVDKSVRDVDKSSKGAKAGLGGMTAGAKGLGLAFKAIGIGLIVAAFMKLKELFSGNIETARKFEVMGAKVSAMFDVLRDRLEPLFMSLGKLFTDPLGSIKKFWEALKQNIVNRVEGLILTFGALGRMISAVFNRDLEALKEAASDAGAAFIQLNTGLDETQQKKVADTLKGITKEIKEETTAVGKLTEALQRVRDEERDMLLIRAKANKIIAESRLLAEDDTKSMVDRLAALKAAVEEEKRVADMEVATQNTKVKTLQAIIDLGKSSEEDIAKLAEERARLIDLQTASVLKQKRVAAEIGTFTNQIAKEEERIEKEKLLRIELTTRTKELNIAITEELTNKEIAALIKAEETKLGIVKKAGEEKAKLKKAQIDAVKAMEIGAATSILGSLGQLAGQGTKMAKATALAAILINTAQSISAAVKAGAGLVFPANLGAIATGVAAALSGIASAKAVFAKIPGGGDEPDTPDSIPKATGIGGNLIPNLEAITPTELGGATPVQAYVVENDISDAQALQEELDIQATL